MDGSRCGASPTFGVLVGGGTPADAAKAAYACANDRPRWGSARACEAHMRRRLLRLPPEEDMIPAERGARDMLLLLCGHCGACVFARVR
jgi:hypothetical protein